jgi:hypothetical protein
VKDKNKHFADIKKFGSYKFGGGGFMVRNAIDSGTPMPFPGSLRFFEIQNPISYSLVNSTYLP